MIDKIKKLVNIKSNGACLRTKNIEDVVKLITMPGNLLEIGAGEGETTVKILNIIHESDRALVVVDPWNYSMGPYNKQGFVNNVTSYCDEKPHLAIIEKKSQEARDDIRKAGPYCFAFVDGLQTDIESVQYDIETCMINNISIICVDDYNYRPNVIKPAIDNAIEKRGGYYCVGGIAHETYLIRGSE